MNFVVFESLNVSHYLSTLTQWAKITPNDAKKNLFIDEFRFLRLALFFTVPQKCNANYLQKFIARIADANIYFVEFFWAALK